MRKRVMVGMIILVFSGMAVAENRPERIMDIPVFNTTSIDLTRFNKDLAAAVKANEAWVSDPVSIALWLAEEFEGKEQHIIQVNNVADGPDKARVIILRDGYLDDSIRGERFEINLELSKKGDWMVKDAKKAWRCWEERRPGFTSDFCP